MFDCVSGDIYLNLQILLVNHVDRRISRHSATRRLGTTRFSILIESFERDFSIVETPVNRPRQGYTSTRRTLSPIHRNPQNVSRLRELVPR